MKVKIEDWRRMSEFDKYKEISEKIYHRLTTEINLK